MAESKIKNNVIARYRCTETTNQNGSINLSGLSSLQAIAKEKIVNVVMVGGYYTCELINNNVAWLMVYEWPSGNKLANTSVTFDVYVNLGGGKSKLTPCNVAQVAA